MKYLVLLLSFVVSGVVLAEEYNHGNHNDPYIEFFNGTETFNCGSLSFYACTSQSSIQSMVESRCESKVVTTDNGGYPPYGQPYYHGVQGFNIVVQSVTGPAPYSMQISFKCGGYRHPGQKYELSL